MISATDTTAESKAEDAWHRDGWGDQAKNKLLLVTRGLEVSYYSRLLCRGRIGRHGIAISPRYAFNLDIIEPTGDRLILSLLIDKLPLLSALNFLTRTQRWCVAADAYHL